MGILRRVLRFLIRRWVRRMPATERVGGPSAEAGVVVTFDHEWIRCQRGDGVVEAVKWEDLEAVLIETTDEGPIVPDVFWILVGGESGCVFPNGASGEGEILREMQRRLRGFDNTALIEAVGSFDNGRFVVWSSD